MNYHLRQHRPGCYRLTLDDARFGQVLRVGSRWQSEIRQTDSGLLVRYMGIWPTRREAVDELLSEANRRGY